MYDLTAKRSAATSMGLPRAQLLAVVGDGPSALNCVAEVSWVYLDHLVCINATFYDQLKVVDQKAAYVSGS